MNCTGLVIAYSKASKGQRYYVFTESSCECGKCKKLKEIILMDLELNNINFAELNLKENTQYAIHVVNSRNVGKSGIKFKYFFEELLPILATWKHYCDKCVFLGKFIQKNNPNYNQPVIDLYYCREGGISETRETLIARFGNDPSEYISGLYLAEKSEFIAEAKKMAIKRGLLKPQTLEGEI